MPADASHRDAKRQRRVKERLKKVVTKSGEADETVVYLYDGQKIIETRDGSGNLARQFIHGTQYIDELVMIRVKDKGDLYVHQAANWNVIGLTDLGGSLVERYAYTPYGELTVYQETGYGDYDGDGDMDDYDEWFSHYNGTPGDPMADFRPDGVVDALDYTFIPANFTGSGEPPITLFTSGIGNPYFFTGRRLHFLETLHDNPDPEDPQANWQVQNNRNRHYHPVHGRWLQRDPSGYADGMNLYEYVSSRPTWGIDPTGLANLDPDALARCYERCARSGDRESCIGDCDHRYGDDRPPPPPEDKGNIDLDSSCPKTFSEGGKVYNLRGEITRAVDKECQAISALLRALGNKCMSCCIRADLENRSNWINANRPSIGGIKQVLNRVRQIFCAGSAHLFKCKSNAEGGTCLKGKGGLKTTVMYTDPPYAGQPIVVCIDNISRGSLRTFMLHEMLRQLPDLVDNCGSPPKKLLKIGGPRRPLRVERSVDCEAARCRRWMLERRERAASPVHADWEPSSCRAAVSHAVKA